MLILSSFRCQSFLALSFGVGSHPILSTRYPCSYSSRTFSYKACQLVYYNLKVTKDAVDQLVQVQLAFAHLLAPCDTCTDSGVPRSKHYLYAFTLLLYLFPFAL